MNSQTVKTHFEISFQRVCIYAKKLTRKFKYFVGLLSIPLKFWKLTKFEKLKKKYCQEEPEVTE